MRSDLSKVSFKAGTILSQQGTARADVMGWVQRAVCSLPMWSCYSWCDSWSQATAFFQNSFTIDTVSTPSAYVLMSDSSIQKCSLLVWFIQRGEAALWLSSSTGGQRMTKSDSSLFHRLPSWFRAVAPCWLSEPQLWAKEDPLLFPHLSLELLFCLQGTRQGFSIRWSFGALPLKSQLEPALFQIKCDLQFNMLSNKDFTKIMNNGLFPFHKTIRQAE